MTTNTNKLAEAIGIISSVLADEIALTQHFVEVEDDEEETVPSSIYEELKELITDGLPDIMTDIENIKTEAETAVELDGPGEDDEYIWDTNDDEGEEDNDGDEKDGDNETEPTDKEKMDVLVISGTELQETNERLLAALESTSEQLSELATAMENLQGEVEQY